MRVCMHACPQKDNTPQLVNKILTFYGILRILLTEKRQKLGPIHSHITTVHIFITHICITYLNIISPSTLRSLQVFSSLRLLFCSPHACYITRHVLLDWATPWHLVNNTLNSTNGLIIQVSIPSGSFLPVWSQHSFRHPHTGWHKKKGTFEKPNKNWRNPRKKIYWQKLNHYNLPFKRQ